VYVDKPCTGEIFVPNAFSPNGDGQNDKFRVHGNCFREFLLRIYDRWGEKVFESNSPGFAWDGTFRGQEMDPAVFVWYLEATFVDGTSVNKKGNVSLVR
jgi:gliding motility-associated-like protein